MLAPPPALEAHFVSFGAAHVSAMLAIAAIAIAGPVAFRHVSRRRPSGRVTRAVCVALAGLLIATILAEALVKIATGTWTLQESLPLHLCDLVAFALIAVLTSAARSPAAASTHSWRQLLYELAYYWGLGGTVQAIVTPDLREGFPHFHFIQYFLAHGGIVVGVLMLTVGLAWRPRPGSVLRTWLITTAVGFVVLAFNGVFGTNYMFLCGPPPAAGTTLLDYLGPWPLSLVTLDLLALVLMMLCYAPFWLAAPRGAAAATASSKSPSP